MHEYIKIEFNDELLKYLVCERIEKTDRFYSCAITL
jgi:hypothetical protein